jgi:hypothetical protein
MIKWLFLAVAVVYMWLYPSILLVPDEYRQGFWSADYNVVRRGVIMEREIYETQSVFYNKTVYRIRMLVDGTQEHFWVANTDIVNKLISGELVIFETRGKVIVLAEDSPKAPLIVSLINY